MTLRTLMSLRQISLGLLLACAAHTQGCNNETEPSDAESEHPRAATQQEAGATSHEVADHVNTMENAKPAQSAKPAADTAKPNKVETAATAQQTDPDSKFCGVLDLTRNNCQRCHAATPVAGAPMPLVSYADFTAPAVSDPQRKVYELVRARVHDKAKPMPPAPAQLSAADLTSIDVWVDQGALAAAKACPEPATVAKPTGTVTEGEFKWPADCEERYTFVAHDRDDPSKPYMVPANTQEHPSFDFDTPWGDADVHMLATRPITDNAKVIHHWILWDTKERASLAGWAPGGIPDMLPNDVGMFMPKGQQTLTLDMHYYNLNGAEPQPDRSGLEICITRTLRPKTAANTGLNGSAVVKAMSRAETPVACNVTTDQEVHFLGVNPHMHQLGVHAKLELTRAGVNTVLWDAPFAFTEQAMHPLDNIHVMTGDVLTTTCTYVNDRPTDVQWGDSTDDEMCINWVRYYPRGAFHCKAMSSMSNQ